MSPKKPLSKKEIDALAKKALANAQEIPPEDLGDFFMVFPMGDSLFAQAAWTLLLPAFDKFSASIEEFAYIELVWWCQDRKLGADEQKRRWEAASPALYHIDFTEKSLIPLTDKVYQKARQSPDRIHRQFALLSRSHSQEAVVAALQKTMSQLYRQEIPGPFKLLPR